MIEIQKTEHTARIERVSELIVSGLTTRQVQKYVAEKHADWNATPKDVMGYVRAAQRLVGKAASVDLKSKTGMAIKRLETIFAMSLRVNDTKTALATQKEINRMHGLAEIAGKNFNRDAERETMEARRTAEAIRAYLVPLQLAPEHVPIEEHARLAAEIVRTSGKLGDSK